MTYSVGEVAGLTGLTHRTLHHYDELRLVVPDRTHGGHRVYTMADLERLQQVLFLRELGFPLGEIRSMLDAPDFDRREALIRQRAMVGDKITRLERVVDSIDRALVALDEGAEMDTHDMFGGFDPSRYEAEVEERWGDTEAYRQSKERTATWDGAEWSDVAAEAEGVAEQFAELMRAGAGPGSDEARSVAEAHRAHIGRFYDCSHEMHVHLGEMYVTDPRFTAYWDDREPGLAVFVRDAIVANARGG